MVNLFFPIFYFLLVLGINIAVLIGHVRNRLWVKQRLLILRLLHTYNVHQDAQALGLWNIQLLHTISATL